MLPIPPGTIVLKDEGSRRQWTVAVAPFAIANVPVTRALYATVVGQASASPESPRVPVTDVSWLDAVRFCNLLSERESLRPCYTLGDDPDARDVMCDWTADGYRLPSEAEWEYACRAGSNDPRPGPLEEIAWYRDNSGGTIHDVATKAPNAWGLYDTIGNVWEWCWDLYDTRVYGGYRVFRGGGWADPARSCRASCRRKSHPTFRMDDLGFRIARSR